MKRTFKRLFKTMFFRAILVWLAANYIRLVYYTSRRSMDVHILSKDFMSGEANAIFAFWHGRMMMIPPISPPKRKVHVIISSHRDGEMIARTMQQFGFGTVRGSSSRGGAAAGREAKNVLQDGDNIAITPDGPRGPAMKVQKGAVSIAAMAHVPVVPVTFSTTRYRNARSWDRFVVALPFGRLYYKIGAPLWYATPEALEVTLIALTKEADAHVRAVS